MQPFSPTPAALTDESWPASLVLSSGKIEMHIMSTEAIRNTYWRYDEAEWTKRLALLESSLRPGARLGSPFDLPMTRIDESGLFFAAMEKRLDGGSFRSLRWVANFSPVALAPFNPLIYIAEGISRDGRYFLLVRAGKLAAAPAASFKPSLATFDSIVQSIKLP
jgi:hypothetical protein